MSERKFIFRGGSRELTLPVTPQSYRVENGVNIEVVNIHELGDVILTGYGTLATIKIPCMFPAQNYSFARSGNPDRYVEQIQKWVKKKTKLRFIVSGTGVNVPVVIQNFSYGEQDGTNDVYADLILREYRTLKAVRVQTSSANRPRTPVVKTSGASLQTYTIKYGDTLCGVCRKYYGDGSYAKALKLAAYNGIPNANIIYVGQVVKIPQPLN